MTTTIAITIAIMNKEGFVGVVEAFDFWVPTMIVVSPKADAGIVLDTVSGALKLAI